MAIVFAPGAGEGLDPLMRALITKEQLAQQKEALKIEQGKFKLQQDQWMSEQGQQKALEEASMLMLEKLGQNLGVDPSAAPALLENIRQERDFTMRQAESTAGVDLTRAQISNFEVQKTLEEQRLALEERRVGLAEVSDENERAFRTAALNLDERRLTSEENRNRIALASQEWQNALQIGASTGDVMGFLRTTYGEFTSPQEILARMESGEIEMKPQARLMRFLSGMQIDENTQNTLNEALFTDGLDPQAVLQGLISNPEIDDQSKASLTLALTSVFEGLQLPPPPPEDPGMWARIFQFLGRGFQGGAGGGSMLPTPGVRQSPTGA